MSNNEEVNNKVFIAKFDGHWLGGIAIVTARNEQVAEELVKEECNKQGLSGNDIEVWEVTTDREILHFFENGDY